MGPEGVAAPLDSSAFTVCCALEGKEGSASTEGCKVGSGPEDGAIATVLGKRPPYTGTLPYAAIRGWDGHMLPYGAKALAKGTVAGSAAP